MRKFILVLLLIILSIISFCIISIGINIGPLKIYSYSEIEKANFERKNLLAELNNKNENEFETTQELLSSAVEEYQEKKEQYNSLIESGELTAESNIYNSSLYDIDSLLTTVGKYAKQNGVTLQFDIFKSTSSTSVSTGYIICDLNFTVTGDYIPITNYISSLENDGTLNFEISDFALEKSGQKLQATFTVKNIPINSKNLSSTSTTSKPNIKVMN